MTGFVIFRTTGKAGDERLIREYVFDAVDRLPERSGCDGVGFNPLARKAGLAEMDSEGGVLMRLWGNDIAAVVDHERERWDALVDNGLANDWEWSADDGALVEYMGEQGATRYLEFLDLATRLSKPVYQAFDEPPDPVDEYPEEDRAAPAGVGWWQLLHLLTIQQNYRYSEEIDVYAEGICSTVHTIAEFDGHDRALHEVEAVIDALEALRSDLAG